MPSVPTAKAGVGSPSSSEAQSRSVEHALDLAPAPGATATFIADLRELFKFKVTAMVLVTTWAGFYLGSINSGITSFQRGLFETLVGVALVSAGASALNEALERKSDAR